MNAFNRVLGRIDRAVVRVEEILCCILVLIMALIIFLQIICRFLKYPLVWSEELSRFMFIWLIYITASFVVHREKHLCVDILPLLLPAKGTLILKIIANILSMAFFLFVAYYGIEVIEKLIARPQVSAAMQINMIWGYSGPYVGAALACIHYLTLIFRDLAKLFFPVQRKEVND